MKKILSISALVLVLGIGTAHAQDAESDVKKDASKVGHKTAEIASKVKSDVVDKVYKGKEGPDGQTIYIDKHSKYYWVDKKGHNVYIAKSRLRNKN